MPYYIDPLIAALATYGAVHLLTHLVRVARVALALAARVRLWWRWRVVMARGYRPEVPA